MEQDIKAKRDEQLNLNTTYETRRDEVDHIDQEIERVSEKYHIALSEMEDSTDLMHREREDLMYRIRGLTREIRLKHLIIDQFIPSL
jgi:kinesin family protein 3/17